MITIDRSAAKPVQEQLIEQLRYLIASGHFSVEDTLPSTRALGRQLGLSFHTVRKAYQHLEQEGLLQARQGSGFTVVERLPLDKGERMERGAGIVYEALQHLIGLGLEEQEIEYLFQEQLELLEGGREGHKLVFVGAYREEAAACAEQVADALQRNVEPITLAQLGRHRDADYVFTLYRTLQTVMAEIPQADAIGVSLHLKPDVLNRVARLLPHQTLGLVSRYADAIPHLMASLRGLTAFSGQVIATSTDEGSEHLASFFEQADLIVYTAGARRRLLSLLTPDHPAAELTPVISHDSLMAIRQAVPR